MRVVFDTNVVMSGLFFGGRPSQILEAWHQGGFEWVVSAPVLTEYRRVGAELGAQHPPGRAVADGAGSPCTHRGASLTCSVGVWAYNIMLGLHSTAACRACLKHRCQVLHSLSWC